MATEFTGIVLAGGRSTRMGRDKATLPWADGTLLDHMIATLRRAGATHVLVSGDRPAHDGIPDAWPGQGPVAGIASALARCTDGVALVVPADLPLLDGQRIHLLLEGAAHHSAVHCAGHPLPCALRVDAHARRVAVDAVEASPGGAPVRHLLAALDAIELPAGDTRDLRPCNTPADWAAIAR